MERKAVTSRKLNKYQLLSQNTNLQVRLLGPNSETTRVSVLSATGLRKEFPGEGDDKKANLELAFENIFIAYGYTRANSRSNS